MNVECAICKKRVKKVGGQKKILNNAEDVEKIKLLLRQMLKSVIYFVVLVECLSIKKGTVYPHQLKI